MSLAVTGVGTVFQRWANAQWNNIAEIVSITGPSMTRDTVDVSSLSSTGGYREFAAALRNPGTVKFTMNFLKNNYILFKADFESNTPGNYRIILPDPENTMVEVMGLVTELPLTIPTSDKITCDVTIQLTGPIDIDSGFGGGAGSANLGLP
jgi:predicted secreted protein